MLIYTWYVVDDSTCGPPRLSRGLAIALILIHRPKGRIPQFDISLKRVDGQVAKVVRALTREEGRSVAAHTRER